MDNFIIDEFENSKPPRKKKNNHSLEEKRRNSIITIFEQSGGLIGPDEIADALDIDVELVKTILGVKRIEQYEILVGKKKPSEPKRSHRKKVDPVEENERRKMERIIAERNMKIFELSAQGMTLDQVHERTGIRKDQLREIYMSLGLNIYTKEEIEAMRKQNTVPAPETNKKSIGKEAGEGKADDKRKKGTKELQEGKKTDSEDVNQNGEKANQEQEFEELKAKITNFGDIGKLIKGFVAEGRIDDAIKYGQYFMNNLDSLTIAEKDKLFVLLEYMKSIKTRPVPPRHTGEISDDGETR